MNDELKLKYDAALEKLTPEYVIGWIKDLFPKSSIYVGKDQISIYNSVYDIQACVDITNHDKLDHAAMANKVQWVCKAFMVSMLNAAIPKE
jgi:hypothetical protein